MVVLANSRDVVRRSAERYRSRGMLLEEMPVISVPGFYAACVPRVYSVEKMAQTRQEACEANVCRLGQRGKMEHKPANNKKNWRFSFLPVYN